MGKCRQVKLRMWAITLAVSGFFSFITIGFANFSQSLMPHAQLNSSFSAFVFPNPIRTPIHPTLVVEPGTAEKITARIYDPAGILVFQTRVDDHALKTTANSSTYEVPLNVSLTPGVYVGLVLGYAGDSVSEKSIVRFSVVR